MHVWLVGVVLASSTLGGALPAPPVKAAAFTGKVRPLAAVLTTRGVTADADTAGVALVADDGTVYPLVKDDGSRMLFLDTELHDRAVRLTARPVPKTQMLVVEKVQVVTAGKLFDVDYWCENCQLRYTQPGKCWCCGGDTARRELPAK